MLPSSKRRPSRDMPTISLKLAFHRLSTVVSHDIDVSIDYKRLHACLGDASISIIKIILLLLFDDNYNIVFCWIADLNA